MLKKTGREAGRSRMRVDEHNLSGLQSVMEHGDGREGAYHPLLYTQALGRRALVLAGYRSDLAGQDSVMAF